MGRNVAEWGGVLAILGLTEAVVAEDVGAVGAVVEFAGVSLFRRQRRLYFAANH